MKELFKQKIQDVQRIFKENSKRFEDEIKKNAALENEIKR